MLDPENEGAIILWNIGTCNHNSAV